MKRVFIVNNGFTELMAHHVVADGGFLSDDCMLIHVRRGAAGPGVQIQSDTGKIPYDNSINDCSLWHLGNEVHKARELVRSEFGDAEFICYVHHTRSRLAQALIGSDCCVGYYMIEEGMAAYMIRWPEPMRDALGRYARFLFTRGQLGGFGSGLYFTAHKKFLGAVAASEQAFPGIAKKRVVGWPFSATSGHSEIDALLVFDGGSLSEVLMRDAIRRFSQECWQGVYSQIAYKFHPRHGQEFCRRMRGYLDEVGSECSLKFLELPGVVLENLCFTRGQSLSVYFIISSVGFYAAMMGCRAVSLARFYGQDGGGVVSRATAVGLGRFLENLPEAFASRVQFL